MIMIPFNDPNIRTTDGKYTQRDLILKIKRLAYTQGYGKDVAQSVINSFVNDGIIEIYNELGHEEWAEMIYEMIKHEGIERSIHVRIQ